MSSSSKGIDAAIAALGTMSPAQLRTRYQEVFGEATNSGNRDFLIKRLAWRLQSLAEGGLSERAKRRADELARDADDRLSRSLLDFARVMQVFEQHRVSFVSVTQQFNTTHSMGRLDSRDLAARLEAVERVLKLRRDEERREARAQARSSKRRVGHGY